MAFIEDIPDAEASEEVVGLYKAERAEQGFVDNQTLLFAHRPAVLAGWRQLKGAIASSMDTRRYELVTLAAARRLHSTYCMLAHGQVLAERFLDPEVVREVARGHRSAGLDAVDVAVMDLAEKVVDDATSVTQEDIDHLRGLGLADEEIFDVVAAAAVRCFFSKTLDALGAQADASYAQLDPALREVLVVGRPIASS